MPTIVFLGIYELSCENPKILREGKTSAGVTFLGDEIDDWLNRREEKMTSPEATTTAILTTATTAILLQLDAAAAAFLDRYMSAMVDILAHLQDFRVMLLVY
ncbi:unnamed protein product [Cercopithifilaria johnstoni]|uniref:Uncharacterized protein n=1 Tax=Cercopithifilaria johnstoni TaxID=2874296 RepID=A0A8J2Q8L5_9BILA|nr:unnamed protein product [Cercopithifilaria johnstoni]